MTRHSPVRFVLAVFLAGLLVACGGGETGVDEAGNEAAASAAGQGGGDSGSSDGEDDGGDEGGDDGEAAGRPGGPEPEEPDGARPGGPFDVEAFEQIGQPAEDFLPFGRDYCSGGRCTLVEETVEDSNVGYCGVSSFSYDPPAQPEGASPSDQFIQRGTTVTVVITCPPESSEEESTEEGATEEGTSEEEVTEEEVTEEEVTEEETAEEESSEEESTEEEPAA